ARQDRWRGTRAVDRVEQLYDPAPGGTAPRDTGAARREPGRVPSLPVSEGLAGILRAPEDPARSIQPPHPRSSTQSSSHFSDRIEATSDPDPGLDSLEPPRWVRRHSRVQPYR